jgi:hypothetical protein
MWVKLEASPGESPTLAALAETPAITTIARISKNFFIAFAPV